LENSSHVIDRSSVKRSSSRLGAASKVGYEFAGARSQLFKEAIVEYPHARRDDIALMMQHLDPRPGEHILGFGEGNGFFCRAIADAVGPTGKYVITDPSPEQLEGLAHDMLMLPQVHMMVMPAEGLELQPASLHKVWACGAFHHCPDQTLAMKRIYRSLKVGGKAVIFDVFQGTPLARHFDAFTARYCVTGHEVKFLSDEFAETLCLLAGFGQQNVKIVDIPHRFVFDSMLDIGRFVYKLHALTSIGGTEDHRAERTLESVRRYLPIDHEDGRYVLHWPQKAIIAVK